MPFFSVLVGSGRRLHLFKKPTNKQIEHLQQYGHKVTMWCPEKALATKICINRFESCVLLEHPLQREQISCMKIAPSECINTTGDVGRK